MNTNQIAFNNKYLLNGVDAALIAINAVMITYNVLKVDKSVNVTLSKHLSLFTMILLYSSGIIFMVYSTKILPNSLYGDENPTLILYILFSHNQIFLDMYKDTVLANIVYSSLKRKSLKIKIFHQIWNIIIFIVLIISIVVYIGVRSDQYIKFWSISDVTRVIEAVISISISVYLYRKFSSETDVQKNLTNLLGVTYYKLYFDILIKTIFLIYLISLVLTDFVSNQPVSDFCWEGLFILSELIIFSRNIIYSKKSEPFEAELYE